MLNLLLIALSGTNINTMAENIKPVYTPYVAVKEQPIEDNYPDFVKESGDFNYQNYLNLTKEVPTVEEEDKPQSIIPSGIPSGIIETRSLTGTKSFEKIFSDVAKENPYASKYKNILTHLASNESGFNSKIRNQAGAPAFGYFQFMDYNIVPKDYLQKTRFYSYGSKKAWTRAVEDDPEYKGYISNFISNPKKQLNMAIDMLRTNENQLSSNDLTIAKRMGLSKNALLGGTWLGGIKGVRKLLYNNVNVSDKHYSKVGAGIDMRSQLKKYNFSKGGVLKFDMGGMLEDPSIPSEPVRNKGIDWEGFSQVYGKAINPDNMRTIESKLTGLSSSQKGAVLANVLEESGGDPNAKSGQYTGLLQSAPNRLGGRDMQSQLNNILKTVAAYDSTNWTHGGNGSGYQSAGQAFQTWRTNPNDYNVVHSFTYGYVRPANSSKAFSERWKVFNMLKKFGLK